MNFNLAVWLNGACHKIEIRDGSVHSAPEALARIRTLPIEAAREILIEMGATVRRP